MFLSHRSRQAEYFDAERSTTEVAAFFRCLGRVNRSFAFSEPFERLLPGIAGEAICQALSILDLGAGDGMLGKKLADWAQRRGWRWCVTNLDLSLLALGLNPSGRNVVGSAFALPFQDASFDLVIASQMAHHLSDNEVIRLLREAWRVSRRGILICDLHRTVLVYCALWFLLRAQRHTGPFYRDALLSVKRGWRVAELGKLAETAQIANVEVSILGRARVVLKGLKEPNRR
jgi:SAM-dependent methyltransferase